MKSYKVLLFCSVVILLWNCKKKNNEISFKIEGEIVDVNSNSPLSNIEVIASKREVASGTFNSSYSKFETLTTNSNGKFSVETNYGGIESLKFQFSHANYFSKEIIINPDDLSTEETNNLIVQLQSKGIISINIKNSSPFDQFDNFIFNSINSSCANCVKFNSLELNGNLVDTTLIGQVEANKYYRFQYIVTKNGSSSNFTDSVFCVIGDTTFKVLNY